MRHRRDRAFVAETLASCLVATGASDEAVPAYKEAIDLWSKLLAADPNAREERSRLSNCLSRLGILYCDAGRWDEAESTLTRGSFAVRNPPRG